MKTEDGRGWKKEQKKYKLRWMDGWMDEWMDGWMDGWMEGVKSDVAPAPQGTTVEEEMTATLYASRSTGNCVNVLTLLHKWRPYYAPTPQTIMNVMLLLQAGRSDAYTSKGKQGNSINKRGLTYIAPRSVGTLP